jgi:hypothetical protein
MPRSRSQDQFVLYPGNGLITNNTNEKFESLSTYQSKDIAKVKIFNPQVKYQGQGHRVKLLVPMERSCHKEYRCEISKL